MEADAIALFPGGFGTQDEGFEVLTLLQTGKAPPMPVVLMELPGEAYWETWDKFIRQQLLDQRIHRPGRPVISIRYCIPRKKLPIGLYLITQHIIPCGRYTAGWLSD